MIYFSIKEFITAVKNKCKENNKIIMVTVLSKPSRSNMSEKNETNVHFADGSEVDFNGTLRGCGSDRWACYIRAELEKIQLYYGVKDTYKIVRYFA